MEIKMDKLNLLGKCPNDTNNASLKQTRAGVTSKSAGHTCNHLAVAGNCRLRDT